MKKPVWLNKSNGQLCATIPKNSGIKEGDLVKIEKQKVKRIVYSHSGSDLFHYGHLQLLESANALGDLNVVGVLTEEAIKSYKKEPITSLKERQAMLSGLRCVDMVMVQDSLDPTENLEKMHSQFPDAKIILVHGSDWKKIPGHEYINKTKGEIIKHPYYEKLSEQKILDKISKIYNVEGELKHEEKWA